MNKAVYAQVCIHFPPDVVIAPLTITNILDGGALYRQQQAIRTRRNPKNRNRKRFSVMGRLLVQDAKERRA